ncbi:MAG: TonB family protein [Woeseiaceae bacterium]|nr:TonB family protein [Woeseiaceae bacterium]NIP20577.1 TonB family protein [Woeseiaceae bacterium]
MRISNAPVLFATSLLLVATAPAYAQNYDLLVDNLPESLVSVDRQRPPYPDTGIRTGQEGWVRVNLIVTADGNVADPIIMDSVGGVEFEKSVRSVVSEWTFEPPGEQLANVVADIRFEIHQGRDLATSNFMRRYRRIVRMLHVEDNEEARAWVDQAAETGGWNLYESTMLWLMIGRVEGAEGNDVGKLEAYRRAQAVNTRGAIKGEDRRELLRKMFELEMGQSQYAAADKTLRKLKREPGNKKDIEELAELIARLEGALADDSPLAARATLFNPADSEESRSLWSYAPARRTFSFAALNGNVERFEVRCARDRLEGPVEPGTSWTFPDGAKDCHVFVFGDDGASFDFVEHIGTESGDATAKAAVAQSDGLD